MLTALRRTFATLVAIGLVVYGMAVTVENDLLGLVPVVENTQEFWLLCLGGAGVALLFAWWPKDTRTLPIFNRTMLRWATIVLVCFFLMTVQLVRMQVVESRATFDRVVVTDSGEVYQNARISMDTSRQRRGDIVDRNDRVLVESVQREDGTWERTYPEPVASQVVGYYSPPLYGTSHLEATFNEYLSGTEGGNPVVEWFDTLLHRERQGYDLRLTIDLDLQQQAVNLLGERAGAVVLMDATSGEVLAMAGYPTFDPSRLYATAGQQTAEELEAINAYWAELVSDPRAPLVFRPTQGLYTPGSVYKTITVAGALSDGIIEPDQVFRNEGSLNVDGRVIIEPNRPDESRVDWTLEESYSYSLNVTFAQIGISMGADTLWDWSERFGVNEEIPFDILTDSGQIASSRGAFVDSQALVADTAFGQGEILTTPLHMAMAVCAVVNNGTMMAPYLVQAAIDQEGDVVQRFGPHRWREVISADVASTVRSLMLASANYGYASGAQIEGVTVGGKTGTAETGTGESHSWFTGFAEDGDRKLVVSVIIENAGSGSAFALPVGRDLLAHAVAQGQPVD